MARVKVLITKGSMEKVTKEIIPKVKFKEENQHQVSFVVLEKNFFRLYHHCRYLNLNPYAVMYW